MSKKKRKVRAEIIKTTAQIKKSDSPSHLEEKEDSGYSDWLEPDYTLKGLENMTRHSSILPQCISAYKSNIAGFGIGVRYKEDITDTEELEDEFNRLSDIVELLALDCDTKEVFEKVIAARETYGTAYLEIIRNGMDGVVQIEFIENVPSVQKSRLFEESVEVEYVYKGKAIRRKKRYRKYKQTVGSKTVYFKEFGDKRIMNKETGEYVSELDSDKRANEILEFKLGSRPYGQVRWIGQALNVDGSCKAENLNNNYFENGRHTPMAVIIKGGTLTDESYDKLHTYMNDIKGEAGQHSFLLLEAEKNENSTNMQEEKQPDIELKSLADILQHDELFQDYLDNNRKKVQSAFRLPDLYVGYTTDFNRATAQTAMEVTEKQVFQPERQSLAWIINNKLLNDYGFKHVEVYFREPDITNPDDLYKILTLVNNAGGLTPNKAKEIGYKALGETSDDFEEDWGNIPLAYSKTQSALNGLETQIAKAENNHDDEIVAVMKSVRSLLMKQSKGG